MPFVLKSQAGSKILLKHERESDPSLSETDIETSDSSKTSMVYPSNIDNSNILLIQTLKNKYISVTYVIDVTG